MKNKILADSLLEKSRENDRLDLRAEHNYALALICAEAFQPELIILEKPESGPFRSAGRCEYIFRAIRRHLPATRLFLLCGKSDKEAENIAKIVNNDEQLDRCLYFDSGLRELTELLESL